MAKHEDSCVHSYVYTVIGGAEKYVYDLSEFLIARADILAYVYLKPLDVVDGLITRARIR